MEFIDTHSHIYSEEFDTDRAEVVKRAQEAGVTEILLPDIDSSERDALIAMAAEYPCCTPMVGVHPTSINDNDEWQAQIDEVARLLASNPKGYCAVGEIGLDLYWSRESEQQQRQALEQQICLALKYDLPVAIHCREAWDELLVALAPFATQGLRGVIHAFTGEINHYEELLKIGDFVFGIGGVVTFKKSPLALTVSQMALERIVLETDAPYLTPVPHRGKRNEPAYIPLIAKVVADLHATTIEEVAKTTTATARRMFKRGI